MATQSSTVRFDKRQLRLRSWLRFEPAVAAHYEAEHNDERIASMRRSIYIGLLLYNVYNLTSFVLLTDIVWLSIAARLGLVTTVGLSLAWILDDLWPRYREALAFFSVTGAYMLPVLLFFFSSDPQAAYTVGEFALTLVYGNMLLRLRFGYAVQFTVFALVFTAAAFYFKPSIGGALQASFTIQIATACLFTLYANYLTERYRCLAYLSTLHARRDSMEADTLRRHFEDVAGTDALTGLPNRRVFETRLDGWLDGARRREHARVGVLMIDIDYFKQYNDALGHQAGDHCLVRITDAMRSVCLGNGALCTRYGGEEFVVVMFDATDDQIAVLARRLVQRVVDIGLDHPSRDDGVDIVTISVGGTLSGPGGVGQTREQLVERADQALYRAKAGGRNHVVFG